MYFGISETSILIEVHSEDRKYCLKGFLDHCLGRFAHKSRVFPGPYLVLLITFWQSGADEATKRKAQHSGVP